jgi:hypothetical protein
MLHDLSKQVAHCYRRAAECRKHAGLREAEQKFYLEREDAWLKLARSFEFSERISRVLTERQRKKLREWPLLSAALVEVNLPPCPDCKIETLLHFSAQFVCMNCLRIVEAPVLVSEPVSIVADGDPSIISPVRCSQHLLRRCSQ